ncbi:hypothetical protein [uncultured Winogradskyella sp.]
MNAVTEESIQWKREKRDEKRDEWSLVFGAWSLVLGPWSAVQ